MNRIGTLLGTRNKLELNKKFYFHKVIFLFQTPPANSQDKNLAAFPVSAMFLKTYLLTDVMPASSSD